MKSQGDMCRQTFSVYVSFFTMHFQFQAADSPGPLFLLLAPLRWLWPLVEDVFMRVWWLIYAYFWLVQMCVLWVCEFVCYWELPCFVCSFLIQSFSDTFLHIVVFVQPFCLHVWSYIDTIFFC